MGVVKVVDWWVKGGGLMVVDIGFMVVNRV